MTTKPADKPEDDAPAAEAPKAAATKDAPEEYQEVRGRSVGKKVIDIQARLGVTTEPGYFGPDTEAAVEKLQADNNLPVTGIFRAAEDKAAPPAPKPDA